MKLKIPVLVFMAALVAMWMLPTVIQPVQAHWQWVKVRVFNSAGSPVGGATVLVNSTANPTGWTGTTNKHGLVSFQLPHDTQFEVRVQFAGKWYGPTLVATDPDGPKGHNPKNVEVRLP